MKVETVTENGIAVALIRGQDIAIADAQSALDVMSAVRYDAGCDRLAIDKAAVSEDFFRLETRLAGEVLQKFVNYQVKLAIYGDFSGYSSKNLKDFIYECNRGKDVFFVPDEQSAIAKLCSVP